MKKKIVFMSLLLTFGLFSACSNDGEMSINVDDKGGELILNPEEGELLYPIDLFEIYNRENHGGESDGNAFSLNVLASFYFFNEQLPIGKRSASFFVGSDKDECYVINNLQNLKNIYRGEALLPEIDFDRFTLVIGQKVMPNASYPVIKQNIEFYSNQCKLNLYVPDYNGEIASFQYFYYWALYPKFNTEDISVDFVKDRSIIRSIKDAKGHLYYNQNIEGWCISYDYPGSFDSVDEYFPLNILEEYEVYKEGGANITFSGEIVNMTDDAREALLHTPPLGGYSYYFVYLTNVEVEE